MAYSPTTWSDGQNKYSIKDQSDNVIHADVKVVYTGTGGTAISATNMNKIETGIVNISNDIADLGAIIALGGIM